MNSVNAFSYKTETQASSRKILAASPRSRIFLVLYTTIALWILWRSPARSLESHLNGNVTCKTLSHEKDRLLWERKLLGAKWLLTRNSLDMTHHIDKYIWASSTCTSTNLAQAIITSCLMKSPNWTPLILSLLCTIYEPRSSCPIKT